MRFASNEMVCASPAGDWSQAECRVLFYAKFAADSRCRSGSTTGETRETASVTSARGGPIRTNRALGLLGPFKCAFLTSLGQLSHPIGAGLEPSSSSCSLDSKAHRSLSHPHLRRAWKAIDEDMPNTTATTTVILDNGASTVKAGVLGIHNDHPRSVRQYS